MATVNNHTQNKSKENLAVQLTDLGTQLKLQGKIEDAIKKYNDAIKHNTKYAPVYFNLGVVYGEQGLIEEALRYYELAITYNPTYPEALCNVGVIYKNRNDLPHAIEYYERALKSNPNFTIANNNLAIALTDMGTKVKNEGDLELGIKYYKRALEHNSKYAAAWYNLGVAYAESNRSADAKVAYEMAVEFDPKCAEAYNNLGVIYKDRGNLDQAIVYYQEALKANPNFAQTLNNLGVIYTMLGKLDEAYQNCKKAVQVNPAYSEAYNNLGVLYRDEGDIRSAIEHYDKCLSLDPHSRNAGQNKLLAMNSLPDADDPNVAERIFRTHQRWGQQFCQLYDAYHTFNNDRTLDRPLRIGYLSGDFFTHSVSYFVESVLQYADKTKTHVTCYSNVSRGDSKTQRLAELAHAWRTVHDKSARAAAEMIRDDKIDILVELTGHTAGNRLDIMAMKPAPVTVTWIGYPNTTGLPTIDYRFTDAIVDPPDTKQQYTEKLVRLPGPFLCYTPPADAPSVSPTPALQNGYVTFGSFNNLAKVNDRVLNAWCQILQQVPNSRILMKCKPFASETIKGKLLDRFKQRGIDTKRVDLISLLPTTSEHLDTYSRVDISVDTFPYSGTTTTCEALYMGVPVVTFMTSAHFHAHNVGGSLLRRIPGLESLIAHSEQQYIEIAVSLAKDMTRLESLRRGLRTSMSSSSLCDGRTFGTQLQSVYRDLWKNYLETPNVNGNTSTSQ